MKRGLGLLTGMALGTLATFGVALAGAETGVQGQVTSGGKPLAATCAAGGKSTKAGANGRFTLPGLSSGWVQLVCTASGHRPYRTRLTVKAGQMLTHNPQMTATGRKSPADNKAKKYDFDAEEVAAPAPAAEPPARMRLMRRPSPSPAGAVAYDAFHQVQHNTEDYAHRAETGFASPLNTPLSTFSIDVDTAGYANVRRFLNGGRLPPADAVKIEELVNYFNYDYPDAKDGKPFSVSTEISVAPWNDKHRLVHIGLQGQKVDTEALPAQNLVFLLDVSGSMNAANKLPLLKQAFKMLVQNLRPQDQVSIVVYAGAAGLVLPPTGGKQSGKILAAIDKLSAGGSTAGGAGIKLAYSVAQEHFIKGGNNRVILATDGDFNVGVSGTGALTRLVEEKRETGVFLTVLGFGNGNYKDARMEQLADKGNGNHAYIDSVLEAKKVLVTEMGGTLQTIAKDVKLQVEFNPSKVKGYRLIGYENRRLAAKDFNDDKKDAGELGAGHTVTALYEIIPAGSDEEVPGVDALKYQKATAANAAGGSELMNVKLRYKTPQGSKSSLMTHPVQDGGVALSATSENFRFSAAVAEYGLLLSGSKLKANAEWSQVIALAKGALGEDANGYRFEFMQLAKKAQALSSTAKIAK